MISRLSILLFLMAMSLMAISQNEEWRAWEIEADTLFNRQDFEEASVLYTKIIDASKLQDKSVYPSIYKRAVCSYSLGNFEKAIQDLDIFIPAFPEVHRAKLLRAFVYRELGDDERQLIDLNSVLDAQAFRKAPRMTMASCNRRCWLSTGSRCWSSRNSSRNWNNAASIARG